MVRLPSSNPGSAPWSLQRVSIAFYAELCTVLTIRQMTSVHLSWRCYYVKTTQAMITSSSSVGSPGTVFCKLRFIQKWQGRWMIMAREKWQFLAFRLSFKLPDLKKQCKIGQRLPLATNRKLRTVRAFDCYQNQSPWTTLNCQYALYRGSWHLGAAISALTLSAQGLLNARTIRAAVWTPDVSAPCCCRTVPLQQY